MADFQFLFYEKVGGRFPVEEFLINLERKDQIRHKKIFQRIRLILELKRIGELVPQSYFKHLEDDLWEIRADNVRILCFEDRFNNALIFMAHAIVKKQDKIPKKDLETLRVRRADWEQRRSERRP